MYVVVVFVLERIRCLREFWYGFGSDVNLAGVPRQSIVFWWKKLAELVASN